MENKINIMIKIGSKIKLARQKKRMTQEEVAKLVDKSSNLISEWEHGKKEPTATSLYILIKKLKLKL